MSEGHRLDKKVDHSYEELKALLLASDRDFDMEKSIRPISSPLNPMATKSAGLAFHIFCIRFLSLTFW